MLLIPVVLGAVFAGHSVFVVVFGVFALMMAIEWMGLCGMRLMPVLSFGRGGNSGKRRDALTVIFLWSVASGIVLLCFDGVMETILMAVVVAFLLLVKAWYRSDRQMGWVALGIPYILLPYASFVWLRLQPEIGLALVVWLLVVVWVTDSGAYLAGRWLGGARLAPSISPNKTWSGLLGGVGLALVAGLVAGDILGNFFGVSPSLWVSGMGAVSLAVVSQGGDLLESAIKRCHRVKDSGWIIPGHGGVLDRADGVLAVAPVAALAVLVWEQIL